VLQPHTTVDFDFIKGEECTRSQNLREFHSKVGERPLNLQSCVVLQCGILENWEVSTNQMLSNISIVSQDNINSPVLAGAQSGSQGVELNRLNTCKSGIF